MIDDRVEYDQKEIREMLARIEAGNRQGKVSGLNKTFSAYGLVGFVKFLEGYYIILIKKRRTVAQIGHHKIYKIEETEMVYIPNEIDKVNRDEAEYLKMFQSIDLSSNFYFSYSYDLTHTLQYNMSPCKCCTDSQSKNVLDENDGNIQGEDCFVTMWEQKMVDCTLFSHCTSARSVPNFKFVWNEYLLKSVDLHQDWLLFIIHGFVSQANIFVFGRPLYITLIAKRSKKYAGTRFLKRGANCEGDVANEVETEQIVHDSSVSSFKDGFFTSFVQMRGSIPSHWSQDISKMVPKPPITINIVDPFCIAAGRHFNELFSRYGSPIFVLNLAKKREIKRQESVLSDEFIETISYLNQFLPSEHQINYIGFDMARINKIKDESVMNRLSQIASNTIKSTGIFQSKSNELRDKRCGGFILPNGRILQTGIVRVNCVDCLDRTNTAQFALGKVALAFQLQALGIIAKPELKFETDTVRMLEELYEDHGDTLALQYGGSQLVHRIQTYRKIAPLSSHSRDIMQTLSRYYSNAFSDADKQNVINLFLGIYQANKRLPIWNLYTDFYLHFSNTKGRHLSQNGRKPYTDWVDEEVAKCLPRSSMEVFKGRKGTMICSGHDHGLDEKTDGYYEQYRPYEFTVFANTLAFEILHSCKDLMPNSTANYSPFCIRERPGKRHESLMGNNKIPKNPSVAGHITSEIEVCSDDEDDVSNDFCFCNNEDSEELHSYKSSPVRTFESILINSRNKYGRLLKPPKSKDLILYQNYVNIGMSAGEFDNKENDLIEVSQMKCRKNQFDNDTSFSIELDDVSERSISIYKKYIEKGVIGASRPSKKSIDIYKNYVKKMK